jgi:hypothetical protein
MQNEYSLRDNVVKIHGESLKFLRVALLTSDLKEDFQALGNYKKKEIYLSNLFFMNIR